MVPFIIAKCFAFTLVIGRSLTSNQMVAVTFGDGARSVGRIVSRGDEGVTRGEPEMKTLPGSGAASANQTINNVLRRRKRDILNNPCYKRGSFQTFKLANGDLTFTVACKQSSNTGCFESVQTLTSSICNPVYVLHTATMQSLLQNCACA